VRLEWASSSKEKKQIMLEERKALTQQFMKPTRVLYSPHTSLESMLSIQRNESTDQMFSILPPLEDKSCYFAFMLCPTEHFPEHTYMSAFQYCTYMLLYLKDCIVEHRKTLLVMHKWIKNILVTRTTLVSKVAQSIPI
jgi:hypothetical protein